MQDQINIITAQNNGLGDQIRTMKADLALKNEQLQQSCLRNGQLAEQQAQLQQDLNKQMAQLEQTYTQLNAMSNQQKYLQDQNKNLTSTLQNVQQQNSQTINNLTQVQKQLEAEKADRIAKATQRVQFLEQKVVEEDDFADKVGVLGKSVGIGGVPANSQVPVVNASQYAAMAMQPSFAQTVSAVPTSYSQAPMMRSQQYTTIPAAQ